ncbi:ATP-dependent DNA helicase Hrp3, partial [Coemansia sp. RSA 2673]
MQANDIGSLSINGGSSSSGGLAAQAEGGASNGQRLSPYTPVGRIESTSRASSADNAPALTPSPPPQQPRRRLVQGRPTHGRVVSDTNSDLSSPSDISNISDSDFGEYGSAKPNGRSQVAMKAPRANPAASAQTAGPPLKQQHQQQKVPVVAKGPNYAENSSSALSASPISDDADFTMSELEDDLDDEENADDSDALENSSDGDWGEKTARKRKTKKPPAPASAKGSKRAKGGAARPGLHSSALKQSSSKTAARQRSTAYSDSGDDSDCPVKSYAEDDTDYPGVDFEDEIDSVAQRSKSQAGKTKEALSLIDEDTGEDIIEQIRDFRLSQMAADGERVDDIKNIEFYVKWKGWLPYSSCSWVAADEIGDDAQADLDAFLDREQSLCLPHRSAPTTKAKRPKFQRLAKQPEYLSGGELRDYQLTSLNWMAHL